MNNGAYTARTINSVIDEIEGIPVKNILIVDDNFLTSRRRLAEFCSKIQDRGIDKEFIAYGHARFVAQNPDMMRELRQAGLSGLMVGLEFVTDRELKAFDKNATILDNDRTIDICSELDIELFALFMVNPDWRRDDFRRLASYLKEKDIAFAAFSTITIFPGTELARQQNCIFDTNTRWWRYDLLRLHSNPRYMSPLSYYLWLFYLYMLPGLHFSGLCRLCSRYGIWGTVKLILSSWSIGLEYFVKLLIWR